MDLLKEEKDLRKKGFKLIAGIDEAGRGPLAGPVTACALVLLPGFRLPKELKGIKDSKKLSSLKREEYYGFLKNNTLVEWGTGRVSEKVIDRINIFEAAKLAMQRAVNNLENKIRKEIDFLVIDGNFKIKSSIPQKPIIRADERVFSVMAASVVTKVARDKYMEKLHKRYPKYGFCIHKGYPTNCHVKNLRKYGPCKVHRKTFHPVSLVIKK